MTASRAFAIAAAATAAVGGVALAACARPRLPAAPTRQRPATTAPTHPAPTPSSPSATTTPAPASRGLPATDRLQRERPLARVLPRATAHYRIDFTVAADARLALTVTLLAVLNDPGDVAAYEADLRRYAAEALAFIEAQGQDPATYSITYRPDPGPNPKESP